MNKRTALITGASAGIGRAVAITLGRQGYQLVLLARRPERLASVQSELGDMTNCHCMDVDISDGGALEQVIATLPGAFAEIDVLINNAGLALGLGTSQQANWSDWSTMIDTNCRAAAHLVQLVLPGMVDRNRGHIVNMGSVAGSYPYPGGNIYAASKAFIEAFTLNLKADLFGTLVRVTNIEPGMVGGDSEFSLVRNKGDQAAAAKTRQGLAALEPEDIAECVTWVLRQPAHVNINRIEVMPTAQAPGRMAYDRKS